MQVSMHYIILPTAQEQKLGMEEVERCLANVGETWEEMQQEVGLLGRDGAWYMLCCRVCTDLCICASSTTQFIEWGNLLQDYKFLVCEKHTCKQNTFLSVTACLM